MVKFYSTDYSYDYGFSAVSLAYFLRYPNPYSKHVSSTDTIDRNFDPQTQRLTTVRLHLKRSRLPPAVLKLLPRSSLGAGEDGSTQSFILEKSVIDVKEGWMETESRNLDWNNVLSVIERHTYRKPALAADSGAEMVSPSRTPPKDEDRTDVSVSVTLKSRIGEQIRKRRQRWGQQATATSVVDAGGPSATDEEPVRQGWFNSWTSGAMRSAIESISLQRTEKSQPKARKGMSVVLARLQNGGLQEVLEGMRQDRELA
ncbi:UPS1, mitochondrial [Lecanosticta acicola]|uniref:UPS1, mitochondrial n=1 Tax=Lecanosticta acicola TaxID=111012 RepID=A0AAI8W128_9PEZI|nr:UPS1, mitochondrial [Lecanosticta acicola]